MVARPWIAERSPLERWVVPLFLVLALTLAQDLDGDLPDQAAPEEMGTEAELAPEEIGTEAELAPEEIGTEAELDTTTTAPGEAPPPPADGELKPEETVVPPAPPVAAARPPFSPPPPKRAPVPRAPVPARRLFHGMPSGAEATVESVTKEAVPNVLLASKLLQSLGMSSQANELKANVTAISDIALYTQMRKVQNWASGYLEPNDVKIALETAKQGGVPQAEQDAAKAAIFSAVEARLANISGVLAISPSSEAAEDLAATIHFGRNLHFDFDESQIDLAREQYVQLIQAAFTDDDQYFLESLVDNSDMAEVKVPEKAQSRISSIKKIRGATEDQRCVMPTLFNMLKLAHSSHLNETIEAYNLETKTQGCAVTHLDNAMQTNKLDPLLEALEIANEAKVPSAQLAGAASQVQGLASATLQRALAGALKDASVIKNALNKAELAGVSATEIAAAQASIESTLQTRLQNVSVTSPAAIQDLALAISTAQGIGMDSAYTDPARALFQQILEEAYSGMDMDSLCMCVEFADTAGVQASAQARQVSTAFRKVKEAAAAWTSCKEAEFPKYFPLVDLISANGLPNTTEVITLQDQAQSCAASFLSDKMALANEDQLLLALDYANRAGLDTAAASSMAQALALSELQAINASQNADIKGALARASKAGVDANQSLAVQAVIQSDVSARISAAVGVVTYGNYTAASIGELAKAIASGKTIGLSEEELEPAREVYQTIAASVTTGDTSGAVEALVDFADLASVKVSEQLARQVKVKKRIAAVQAKEPTLALLPLMVELIKEATSVGVADSTVSPLRAVAESLAQDHVSACQADHVPIINEAISNAVSALGLSAADVMSAQAVRNR
jgi:hypothetical protein